MPAHSSSASDSFGVIIVLGFFGGCGSLIGGTLDAGFADDVGRAAGHAWPSVVATIGLWAIAAAAELAAHLQENRRRIPLTALFARAVAVAVVGVASLAIAVGLVNLVGMVGGFLAVAAVLAGWVRISARPLRWLLRPTAAAPRLNR
jgi:uncharacterized membrane protein